VKGKNDLVLLLRCEIVKQMKFVDKKICLIQRDFVIQEKDCLILDENVFP